MNKRSDRCGWCYENDRCIRHLVKALNAAPGWLCDRIRRIIEILRRENDGCSEKN